MAEANHFQVFVSLPDAADGRPMGLTAFTAYFACRLRQENPDAVVAILDDLHLELRDGSSGGRDLRLDNAFKRYRRRPEDLEEIASLYLRSLLAPPQPWKLQASDENLRPVLRSREFLQEMTDVLTRGQVGGQVEDQEEGRESEAASPPVADRINDQISVLYVFDRDHSMRYVQARDLEALFTDRDGLFIRAVDNLRESLGQVRIDRALSCYLPVVRGGDTASLLLLGEFWTKARFPVKGDIVVFPLARDRVLVTGSQERLGLFRAAMAAARSRGALEYFITDRPFVLKGGRWLPYKRPRRRPLLAL